MKVVVTGSGGFIGSYLVPHLQRCEHEVVTLSRSELEAPHNKLRGAQAVIHLAGIAHSSGQDVNSYNAVNRDLTLRVAQAASESGVKRFVFVSSTHASSHTHTAYGASKAAAESQLNIRKAQLPEIVVMRPALVYGPKSKGNFRTLVKLSRLPLPLPFGNIEGRRSMVYIGNIASALQFAVEEPNIAGSTFTVTDPGLPLKLSEIIAALRAGENKPRRIFAASWLPRVMSWLGAGGTADKIFGNAVFDAGALFAAGWVPPYSSYEALKLSSRLD